MLFSAFGDARSIVDAERPRWNELVANGPVQTWRASNEDVQLNDLDERDRLRYRLRAAARRMSIEFMDAFDDLPDGRNEFDDDPPVGWGLCLHHVVNQLGYQGSDGEEEIDILQQVLVSRLHAMAAAPEYGPASAERKIEELTAELESIRSDLRDPGDDGTV